MLKCPGHNALLGSIYSLNMNHGLPFFSDFLWIDHGSPPLKSLMISANFTPHPLMQPHAKFWIFLL